MQDLLAAELQAIDIWDAEYRLQLLKHFEDTQSYLARQARRVQIMSLMQKQFEEDVRKSVGA